MKKISLIALSLSLAACSEIPSSAYYNRGDPESLLDVSSEVVNINLNSLRSLNELNTMVTQDPPSRAELSCSENNSICMEARKLLEQYEVPVESVPGSRGATLVYERIMARDCNNRYVDNSINPYNLSAPAYGCSITGNMVQMVSDKRQFTNPSLMDLQDGEKAVQTYRGYLKLPEDVQDDSSGSVLNTIKTD